MHAKWFLSALGCLILGMLGPAQAAAQTGGNTTQAGAGALRTPLNQNQQYQQELLRQQAARRNTAASLTPKWHPLPPDHAKYVEELLEHWQKVSDQVKVYECRFRRWEYDSEIVNFRDPATQQLSAYQVAFGEIRFAAPDKARFETHKLMTFKSPPKKPGDQAEYEAVPGYRFGLGREINERWMSDGKSIFDFDFELKQMTETRIPPELQGNVAKSPLPLLFGAKKEDILNRFWVRYVPKYRTDETGQKQLVQDEYWLEAVPRQIGDSRMYSKLEIILSAKDFMPMAIHMYSPQYDPAKGNFSSRYFLFEERQVNGELQQLKNWFTVFVRPNLPLGWRTVQTNMGQANATTAPGSNPIRK